MRFLITGAAGFIGSHLAGKLVESGAEVIGVDNLSNGSIHNLNLAGALKHPDFDFIEDDLRSVRCCHRVMEGVDYVLHHAALGSVPRSVEDPQTTNDNNVTGTLNLLEAARRHQVERFVYAASSSAYGNTNVLPKTETMPSAPLSPYAVSKLAGENYCAAYHHTYGMRTISLRYFNVYGPRQSPDSQYAAVIPSFIARLLAGKAPKIFGDGNQTRDFTYVGNVVAANLACCRPRPSEVWGKTFNIGCGHQITINRLALRLRGIVGADVEPQYVKARPGDVSHSVADIARAQRCLGYAPEVRLSEGLRLTVASFAGGA